VVEAPRGGGLLHDGTRDVDALRVQGRGGGDGVVARLQPGGHRSKEHPQGRPHRREGGQHLQQAALGRHHPLRVLVLDHNKPNRSQRVRGTRQSGAAS
jgi:hypothetical protein